MVEAVLNTPVGIAEEVFDDAWIAAEGIYGNRIDLAKKRNVNVSEIRHTPPAGHYKDMYFWDSCLSIVIYSKAAKRRYINFAKQELYKLTESQNSDGSISNWQRVDGGRTIDPELLFFDNKEQGSNYFQPPILALALSETVKAILNDESLTEEQAYAEVQSLLADILPRADKLYLHWGKNRSNSLTDKLIGIIHPHETGRDSDPTYDYIKFRLQRNGIYTPLWKDLANITLDYLQILNHGRKLKATGGDVSKAREIFWANDVMMNCMYVDNLLEMSKLAAMAGWPNEKVMGYVTLSDKVERQILSEMWIPGARKGKGAFFSLDSNKRPIAEDSVGNLFPLILPSLDVKQLEALIDILNKDFNTPYVLPSVGQNSPNFDPHNREKDRLWRGPVWMNMNWYLVERGLMLQAGRQDIFKQRPDLSAACQAWAEKIANSSRELVYRQGACEHYDPLNANGQRLRVGRNFAWSWLALAIRSSLVDFDQLKASI